MIGKVKWMMSGLYIYTYLVMILFLIWLYRARPTSPWTACSGNNGQCHSLNASKHKHTSLPSSNWTGANISQNIGWKEKPHKMALLIPFRDCQEELEEFAPYMEKFLRDTNILHRIYVINQVDEYRFNRATLINVGYLESGSDCDYIAMHDVDLLPLNKKLTYGFPQKGPFHVASPEFHPLYHYPLFVGGILLVSRNHFDMVNGMSNRFWGWGGEDDELALRFKKVGLKVRRPVGLSTGQNNTFRHIHNSNERPRDMKRIFQQSRIRRRLDMTSGLSNVKYTVESRNTTLINGAYVTFINVRLTCDTEKTPWCLTDKEQYLFHIQTELERIIHR